MGTNKLLVCALAIVASACAGTVEPAPAPVGDSVAVDKGPPVDCSRPIVPTGECPDAVPYFWTCTVGDRYADDRETSERLTGILGDSVPCEYPAAGRACCAF
jgi:hypothetical protein